MPHPSWYPDGTTLALTNYGNNQLIQVDSLGAWQTNLTKPKDILAGMCSVNQQNDQLICMAAQLPPSSSSSGVGPDYSQGSNNIYTQNGPDAPALFSSAPPAVGRAPWWSPDGNWIAYEGNSGSGPYQVMLQGAEQQASQAVVVTDSTYGIQHPKWSPDGNSIVMAVACQQPSKNVAVPWRIEMIDVSSYLGS